MRTILGVILTIVLSATAFADPFSHDVTTESKPWTHDLVERDPGKFHFAIVTDRTGGHRPGVFSSAMPQINSMDPDFVISVGDFIEGYTEDEAELDRQWKEFRSSIDQLEMPFFFVPGNHDALGQTPRKAWTRRFGPTYYAFTHKGVLFLCLDSIEGPTRKDVQENESHHYGISDEQIAWAKETLQKHSDARWTFVFMHVPLWVLNEDPARGAQADAGFDGVMESLKDRGHTVFAGHEHTYTRYVRQGHEYFILGTMGGDSELQGPTRGEFDHITWVTVSKGAPHIAPILLNGILPKDVYSETHIQFSQQMAVRATRHPKPNDQQFTFELSPKNLWPDELHFQIDWDVSKSPGWTLESTMSEGTLAPDEEKTIEFTAVRGAKRFPLPTVKCVFETGQVTGEFDLPIMDAYLEASRPARQNP